MYLLAILLAYSLERTLEITRNLHWRRIILRWQHWQVKSTQLEGWRQHELGQVLWAIIPALAIGFILLMINSVLVTFLVSTAGVLLAIQAPTARKAYKKYLEAAAEENGAEQAHQLKKLQQAAGRTEAAPVEHLLLWIHLRQYFAVLI